MQNDMDIQWANATPCERAVAKSTFFIPKPAKRILFPTQKMSMWNMLKFEHPPITSTHPDSIQNLNDFFSLEPPRSDTTEVIEKLQKLPLPNHLLIQRLNIYSRDCWMNGTLSVRYAHIPGEEMCFPLWVVSYWHALLTHVTTVRKPWEKNLAWLNEHRQNTVNKNLCSEADQTYAILGKLPWNSPQFGFDDCKPIHTLWRTLGTSWMNTSVIDAALEVIKVKADVRFDLTSQTLIGHSDIITKLMFFFGGNIEKPKEYTSCDWLNNIGREVFQRGK
ncbi:hypothetical protein F5050DRAFT_1710275 [Lentinula boryana]|uniref:Uncharacterized protein n=1 Tax=Lentinula boryana TaxID=40481 RepID=A0ABQ8QJS3_9AGAR|nr:hypothetical protein F5050DRAFT_1710275 [Lentinula boryana]